MSNLGVVLLEEDEDGQSHTRQNQKVIRLDTFRDLLFEEFMERMNGK